MRIPRIANTICRIRINLLISIIMRVYEQIEENKLRKPKDEIELRLKLLNPVLGKIPTTEKGWERLHKKECKKCPWNGETIFPKK